VLLDVGPQPLDDLGPRQQLLPHAKEVGQLIGDGQRAQEALGRAGGLVAFLRLLLLPLGALLLLLAILLLLLALLSFLPLRFLIFRFGLSWSWLGLGSIGVLGNVDGEDVLG